MSKPSRKFPQKLASIQIEISSQRLQTDPKSDLDIELGRTFSKTTKAHDLSNFNISSNKEKSFVGGLEDSTDTLKYKSEEQVSLNNSHINISQAFKGFTVEGLDELENYVSILTNQNRGKRLEQFSSSKWVISEISKLGYNDKQIEEAIEYVETLPKIATKEEMLGMTVEHLVSINLDQERKFSLQELERDEQNLSIVLNSHFKSHGTPKDETRNQEFSFDLKAEFQEKILQEGSVESKADEKKTQTDKVIEKKTVQVPECEICFQPFLSGNINPPLKCSHVFCFKCYRDYFEEKINMNKVLEIFCPKEGCQHKFEDRHPQFFLSSNIFAKYKKLKDLAVLNQNPNLRWCIRRGCENYVIGKPGCKKIVCKCGMAMCFNCSNRYHPLRSCENVIDKVYSKYAKIHSIKSCPRCNFKIEKDGGCDHITCGKCSYEWCWQCGGMYTTNHFNEISPEYCEKLKKEKSFQQKIKQKKEKDPSYLARICETPILLLFLPLALIFLSMEVPMWVYKYIVKKKFKNRFRSDNMSEGGVALLALLGILFLPISMAFMIFFFIYDGLVDLHLWILEKREKIDKNDEVID